MYQPAQRTRQDINGQAIRRRFTLAGVPSAGTSLPTSTATRRGRRESCSACSSTTNAPPVILARQLAFGVATPYVAVPPGLRTLQFTASGEHTAMPLRFAAGTVHTVVVLDAPSGLEADALIDAAGSQTMPAGGAAAGLGGITDLRADSHLRAEKLCHIQPKTLPMDF